MEKGKREKQAEGESSVPANRAYPGIARKRFRILAAVLDPRQRAAHRHSRHFKPQPQNSDSLMRSEERGGSEWPSIARTRMSERRARRREEGWGGGAEKSRSPYCAAGRWRPSLFAARWRPTGAAARSDASGSYSLGYMRKLVPAFSAFSSCFHSNS